MKTRLVIATALALMLAVGAAAQGRGGGQGMMGGRMAGPGQLIQRPDVQRDLGLTAEQKSKLEALRAEQQAAMQEMRNQGQGGDRQAMMEQMRKFQQEQEKKINEILTPEQQKRLREINVQLQGLRVIFREDVAKELGLTDEQKAKAREAQAKQQEEMQAVREQMQNGEIDRDQMQAIREKMDKQMNEALGAILTQEQKDKLKAMAGKPFKADGN